MYANVVIFMGQGLSSNKTKNCPHFIPLNFFLKFCDLMIENLLSLKRNNTKCRRNCPIDSVTPFFFFFYLGNSYLPNLPNKHSGFCLDPNSDCHNHCGTSNYLKMLDII